jgi:hypothetical protein
MFGAVFLIVFLVQADSSCDELRLPVVQYLLARLYLLLLSVATSHEVLAPPRCRVSPPGVAAPTPAKFITVDGLPLGGGQ